MTNIQQNFNNYKWARAEPHEIPTKGKSNLGNSQYKIGTNVRITADRSKDYQKTGWWVKQSNRFEQINGVCGTVSNIKDVKILNSEYYYELTTLSSGYVREDLLELISDSDILQYPATPDECISPSNSKFKVTVKTEEETKIKIKVKQSIKI